MVNCIQWMVLVHLFSPHMLRLLVSYINFEAQNWRIKLQIPDVFWLIDCVCRENDVNESPLLVLEIYLLPEKSSSIHNLQHLLWVMIFTWCPWLAGALSKGWSSVLDTVVFLLNTAGKLISRWMIGDHWLTKKCWDIDIESAVQQGSMHKDTF